MSDGIHTVPNKVSIVGLLALVVVGLVTYGPSLGIGFWNHDDYTYLHWAASTPLPEYLVKVSDPRLQNFNFRPLARILFRAEYDLFRAQATYYHWVQLLIHLSNSLLLYAIVSRVTRKWRQALLAAVLFVGFSVAAEAIFWISDESPLASFFSLAAILFWAIYLQDHNARSYLLALASLVAALSSKEAAVVVPVALFLLDRVLIRDRVTILELARRYSPFAIVTMLYLAIEYVIQQHGLYVEFGRYSLGTHVLYNYMAYFAAAVLPWTTNDLFRNLALWILGLLSIVIAGLRRSAALAFLMLTSLLILVPYVMAPQGIDIRYLYLGTVPWAVVWAMLFDHAWKLLQNRRWIAIPASAGFACLVFLNGVNIPGAAAMFSELARQRRVPFSDIVRQHPTFPADTRLFFIEPPHDVLIPEVAGQLYLRYGSNVSVGGTYADGRVYVGGRLRAERARLRDYATAFVYYFDEMNRPIEVPVDRAARTDTVPALPQDFNVPIRLEGYELTSSRLRRGQNLVLILYWRATGKSPHDYTVFVHLVDTGGQTISAVDEMPRNGKEKTSEWRMNQFTADAHIVRIPEDAPTGQHLQLEVGLYNLETMERATTIDHQGSQTGDTVVIEPIEVAE